MNIDARQLAAKPKKVGKKDGKDVMEVSTKGGLHLIVSAKDGGFETLGTGPHRAVARHIAKKRAPEIIWTELSKADHVELEHFEQHLPKYEALTSAIRRRQGDEE